MSRQSGDPDSPTILRKQMSAAYRDAFRDKLESVLKEQSEESVTWMVNLHRELIIRLCMFTKREDLRDEIAEACDPVIFKQLLETGHYGVTELNVLIEYVYMWLKKLCAPVRDDSLNLSLGVLRSMVRDSSLKLYTVIGEFVVRVHGDMDMMDVDYNSKMVQDLRKMLSKKK